VSEPYYSQCARSVASLSAFSFLKYTMLKYICCHSLLVVHVRTGVVGLFLQLKVVVVEWNEEPHLVFVAAKPIDVEEELLFDYNDRQSRLPFLKSCPVCSEQAARKRPLPDDSEAEPAAKCPSNTGVVDQATTPAGDYDEEPTTSGTQPLPMTPSTECSETAPVSKDKLRRLAEKTSLSKGDRERLYRAVSAEYSSTLISRSVLESWQPGISEDNLQYLLMRRNRELIKSIGGSMRRKKAKRQ